MKMEMIVGNVRKCHTYREQGNSGSALYFGAIEAILCVNVVILKYS